MVPEADFVNSISAESVKVGNLFFYFHFGLCIGFTKKCSKHESRRIRRVVKFKSILVAAIVGFTQGGKNPSPKNFQSTGVKT